MEPITFRIIKLSDDRLHISFANFHQVVMLRGHEKLEIIPSPEGFRIVVVSMKEVIDVPNN